VRGRPGGPGRPGSDHRYDWAAGAFSTEPTVVPAAAALVVEGCGSSPPVLDPLTVLRVWVEAPADLRLRRGLERDGEALRNEWLRWQERETAVFTAERTRARAGLRVDGAPAVADAPGCFTPLP
jgi:hypothetical protein